MDNGDSIRMFRVFYKTEKNVVNSCAKRGKRPQGSSLYNGLYRETPSERGTVLSEWPAKG